MDKDKEKLRGKLILALGMTLFAIGQSLLFIVVAPLAQEIGMSPQTFGIILGISNIPLLIAICSWKAIKPFASCSIIQCV